MKVFPPELTVPAVTAAAGTVRLPRKQVHFQPGAHPCGARAREINAYGSAAGRRYGTHDRKPEAFGCCGGCEGRCLHRHGLRGIFPVKSADLFIGNAGTAARTLTAALAFSEGNYRIDGIERMREAARLPDLLAALRELGAEITCEQNEGFLPLRFSPVKPRGNVVHIRGNVSSQYLTALLIISPLIAPAEGLKIVIEGELISRPYIKITTTMMAAFGVKVTELPDGFLVTPGQYRAVEQYAVEGDASGASYFLALGALAGRPRCALRGSAKMRFRGTRLLRTYWK